MSYAEKATTNLHALHDLHLPLLAQCRNLEVDIPLQEEVALSDPNRNYPLTDSRLQSTTKDVEGDRVKAVLLSMMISRLRSSG